MIKAVGWGLLFLGSVLVIQTTALNYIAVFGVKPDIVLILFFFLAVHNETMSSTILGFIFGLVLDYSTGSVPGYHALIFSLAGYILGHWKGKILFDPVALPILWAFIATVYVTVISYLISVLFNLGHDSQQFFNASFLVQILWNIVVSPVIWLIFNSIRQVWIRNRRGGFNGND